MTSRRKGTSPLTLEALLFLEYNKDYWWDCPILVQKAMAMKSPKRKNVATYDMDYNAAQAALSENEDTSDDLTSDDLSIDQLALVKRRGKAKTVTVTTQRRSKAKPVT